MELTKQMKRMFDAIMPIKFTTNDGWTEHRNFAPKRLVKQYEAALYKKKAKKHLDANDLTVLEGYLNPRYRCAFELPKRRRK